MNEEKQTDIVNGLQNVVGVQDNNFITRVKTKNRYQLLLLVTRSLQLRRPRMKMLQTRGINYTSQCTTGQPEIAKIC